MATFWIGDFRGRQLQDYKKKLSTSSSESSDENINEVLSDEDDYLIEDFAESTWFSANTLTKLASKALNNSNVIIMLGFIDCVYSCTWKSSFKVEEIVNEYIKTIKELIKEFSNSTFYVCSVNPVTADYPFTAYENGLIPASILNKKIQLFNDCIKKETTINYIDSYSYFTNTSFSTRDGVRFTFDTCRYLQNYIVSNFVNTYSVSSSANNFTPRTEAPSSRNKYYYSTDNPFQAAGYGMPNCTAYAWGRFYEILGERPKLSTGNAGDWFSNTADGYKRGIVPELGAVVCWGKQGEAGHVAIIEWISNDKRKIRTSESGWEMYPVWWETERTNDNGNWGASTGYYFQGFIYNPAVTVTVSTDTVNVEEVISKNAYLSESEMKINAKYIWNYLGSRGWTLNAVAGILGNMEAESTINPGIWEGLNENVGPGFGLVQWTPASNLINWCNKRKLDPNDIDSQLKKIEDEKDNGGQYYTNHYKYSFRQFMTSHDSPYTLACAFAFDYERSAVVLWGANSYEESLYLTAAQKEANREALRQRRGKAAEKWYAFLSPYSPGTAILSRPKFSVSNFKIDALSPTSISASFITRLAKDGRYTLYRLFNLGWGCLKNSVLSINSQTAKTIVVSFNENDSLIPNNRYKLDVMVESSEGGTKRTVSMEFKTPQSYPETISEARLEIKDAKLPHDKLLLTTEPISDWGYWGNKGNNHGYIIQLIVNGRCVAETSKTSLSKTLDITLSKDFKGYKVMLGDTIQIGIRTWVKDDNGKTLYDGDLYGSDYVKTSNPICMLAQPLVTYLNID